MRDYALLLVILLGLAIAASAQVDTRNLIMDSARAVNLASGAVPFEIVKSIKRDAFLNSTPEFNATLFQMFLPNNTILGRFRIIGRLGSGLSSMIYHAYDMKLGKDVALKVAKAGKWGGMLNNEYEMLKGLQNLTTVARLYDFIENDEQTGLQFMVMQLLGRNLAVTKHGMGKNFTALHGLRLLLQVLDAIKQLHEAGYVHRDVKPDNFALGLGNESQRVYMLDFGLAHKHIFPNGTVYPQLNISEYRGTAAFSSMMAHYTSGLGRRDDIWSFFFTTLFMLDVDAPWLRMISSPPEEVFAVKKRCMDDPEREIFQNVTLGRQELLNIMHSLQGLKYEDCPDYGYIQQQLRDIWKDEIDRLAETDPVLMQEKRFISMYKLIPVSEIGCMHPFEALVKPLLCYPRLRGPPRLHGHPNGDRMRQKDYERSRN